MAKIDKRVTKDGRVRWTCRVFVGRDAKGKRKWRAETFDREGDAKKWARAIERTRDLGGVVVASSREPLAEYLARWLAVKEGQVSARTIYDYRGIVRYWIEKPPAGTPCIGTVPLNQLTADAFEELYMFMRARALSPRRIQYLHTVLRQALKGAVAKGVLPANPTDHAERPKRAKDADDFEDETVRAMDKDQARRFLEAARADRYLALWHALLTGGLRPSEALGLGWRHVDFENGRVRIERTLSRVGVKGWRLLPTKTKRSRRSVPLPEVTMRELRTWKAKQAAERLLLGSEWENNGLVFTNEFGKPLHLHNLSVRNFRSICERAGLGEYRPESEKLKGRPGPAKKRLFKPAFRLYDCRHTCATLLLEAGVPLKVVSERLGHRTIAVTADIYSHVLPTMQQGAVEQLEAMFGAG